MIAQTGIESAPATSASQTAAASNAVWWLLPLAIACLGLIWYLRRLNNATSQASLGKDSKKKSPMEANLGLSDESNTPKTGDSNRQFKSSKTSSKKKKKAQTSNQQNGMNRKDRLDATKAGGTSVAEPKVSSDQVSDVLITNTQVVETAAAAPSQTTSPTPVPLAAIFEPLRSVSAPRRKVRLSEAPIEDLKLRSVSEESTSRQPSGGKFERMVPSTAYTRAAASRWPASMTNTVEHTGSTRAAEVMSEQAATVNSLPKAAQPQQAVPAAKGLTSFVSKLKSSSSADSVSEGNGLNTISTTEENQ